MIDALAQNLTFLPLKFSRNRIDHVVDPADTSLSDRSRLRYYLEILVPEFPQSTAFEPLVKLPGTEKPPVTSGGATTYEGAFFPHINELLDGFLERTKPQSAQSAMSLSASLTMPYCLREWVENDGTPISGTDKTSAKQHAIKAGLSEEDYAGWGEVFFDRYQQTNRRFLTWQPDRKVVSETSEEYLYFLLNCTPLPTTIRRRVEVTYSDGTAETLTVGSLSGPALYQVACVPAGPAALGLTSLAKEATSYRVWLSDGANNRISEVRSFRIDRQYRRAERHLLFSNSLGGWDTLRLVGDGSQSLKTQRLTAQMERPVGAAADYPELRVVYIQGERELVVSTGFFERAAADRLRYLGDLMLSEELYLVTDRGHQPAELATTSLVDAEDNPDLVSRTFTIRLTTPVQNYSNLPASPAQPARPTGWIGINVVHILDSFGKRTGRGRPMKLRKVYLDDYSVVKPLTEKPNVAGDPDYIDSNFVPGVDPGSTPYPSDAISRMGEFVRTNCPTGQVGGPALIEIAAGRWGGESPGDANVLAEAEWQSLNTQAYANQHGSCTLSPELYAQTVPAGQFWYRTGNPASFGIYWYSGPTGSENVGNTWDLQGQNRPFIYPVGTHNFALPVKPDSWRMLMFAPAGSTRRLQIWSNGTLQHDQNYTMNSDGYEHINMPFNPASGARLYFKLSAVA
ncbi:DUF5977 domain-containing protein [Tellurirhabdus rosea]|uniref:DUF5977 domain-containing protein n=1 Tax=Tellurirhabdus rosea TaxID=2674997 RepID=UPI00224D7695|nr:DUF5977 domain-containing protein [Tellurirhabdus rosea]